ncbi:CtsR family transcriptional regulator [Serpentinicella sp. ANB-PHB4]|uniref:CtsR family transcriptional regulator n=1 Tax=Serpentinicella sp. ANB-PHB4 TaxID=3074076 RepID=UPI0028646AA9|nr:CtsR family transcriptional regulator [Serpentinicella sp. ANB-PHB4]MDR5659908.1 CtsR family transcriptional regulator [Serpentinicella sp. ANB-PHB4]
MPRMSDVIEAFIKELFQEGSYQTVEIQRNELAKYFDCAPSQISYVLTTRFTLGQGYRIDSQKGGGGHIRISRILVDTNAQAYRIICDQIGSEISKNQAEALLRHLYEQKHINVRELNIIKAAIDDQVISTPLNIKDKLRAKIMKSIIAVVLE